MKCKIKQSTLNATCKQTHYNDTCHNKNTKKRSDGKKNPPISTISFYSKKKYWYDKIGTVSVNYVMRANLTKSLIDVENR